MTDSKKFIRILCFGDSNTWGYSPQDGSRYGPSVRWTGVLQNQLGHLYQVIEEGLNGRTTNIDYQNRPGRNGWSYLLPCLESHYPLDILILCLGTNDLKIEFARSAQDIAAGMEELIKIALGQGLEKPSPQMKVILVAPAPVVEVSRLYVEALKGAREKVFVLASLYAELAKKYGLSFVDLTQFVTPSPIDGVHLSAEMHLKIAHVFHEVITGKKPC